MPLSPHLPAVPTFDTERLHFRGHRPGDFAASFAMWADPAVVRFITGKPSTEEEAWARLLRVVGHWAVLGYGYWLVEERATGRFVGEVGFGNLHRELSPPLGDTPEAGWVLASWCHGKGFATEAVRAVLAWGDAHLGTPKTACIIDPSHAASIRVAEKCGYREIARTTYKTLPTVLFERPTPGR